jgi:hypothetical protein
VVKVSEREKKINPDKNIRITMRAVGVFVFLVSFIFVAMFLMGSGSSTLILVLALAGLFSIVSSTGLLFLKHWARIYSITFFSVAWESQRSSLSYLTKEVMEDEP